jgi:hypothetical protein
MNSYTNASQHSTLEFQRQQLEQLWQPANPSLTARATQLMKQVGGWLLTVLTESNRLHIWPEETSKGTRWHVQDPLTQRQHQFDSEAALRSWLERRYYEG